MSPTEEHRREVGSSEIGRQETISAITAAFDPSTPTPGTSAATTPKTKLKRNRLTLSCQPCHRRKQQCDRGHPCQRCIKRGSTDVCFYEGAKDTDAALDPSGTRVAVNDSNAHNLSGRVAQLESLVQATFRGLEPTALAGIEALLQLVQASSVHVPSSASHPQLPEPVPQAPVSDSAIEVAATALGQLSQQGQSYDPVNIAPITEIITHLRSAGESIPAAGHLSNLRNHFPNHAITTSLLTHFFDSSSIPWLWSVLHRPVFDSYYVAFSSDNQPPNLDFIALLAIVCALSLQFLPDTAENAALFVSYVSGRHVMKKRLLDFSRSVLSNAGYDHYPTLERIQALLLFALYHENEGNLSEYYIATGNAIRIAQSLGMNRDQVAAWPMKPFEAEIRRRLWWSLYTLDRLQCFSLRRPYIIQDQHCDVNIPLNLDQSELHDSSELVGKHFDHLTDYTFHLLQIQWAKLIGRMWEQCFSVQTPTYSTVMAIEDKIRKLELSLPAAFRSQTLQGAMSRPYLIFQNEFLTLQIYHARLSLLRPFIFLRPTPVDGTGHAQSEKDRKLMLFHRHAQAVCITFCKRLLALQHLMQGELHLHHPAHLRWSSLAHRTFDPALTLSVAIIMDPQNPENVERNEWIALADVLLRCLSQYNAIASNAVSALSTIRRRVQNIIQTYAHGPSNPNIDTSLSSLSVDPKSQYYIERTTVTLAQPQPSVSDLLGGQFEASDHLWSTTEAGAFAGNFPGLEALCGNHDPALLENFLDSCATR